MTEKKHEAIVTAEAAIARVRERLKAYLPQPTQSTPIAPSNSAPPQPSPMPSINNNNSSSTTPSKATRSVEEVKAIELDGDTNVPETDVNETLDAYSGQVRQLLGVLAETRTEACALADEPHDIELGAVGDSSKARKEIVSFCNKRLAELQQLRNNANAQHNAALQPALASLVRLDALDSKLKPRLAHSNAASAYVSSSLFVSLIFASYSYSIFSLVFDNIVQILYCLLISVLHWLNNENKQHLV